MIHHPEFRVYALAALASLDQAASHMKLRKLMDEPDIEVRYGAFNALRTLDPHDPFLGQVRVLNDPKPDDDAGRAGRLDGDGDPQFGPAPQPPRGSLRPLYRRLRGPPLVHVSRSRRAEIVIFGRQQKLLTPIVLGSGAIQFNAADNDEKVELSKIVASVGDSDTKVTTSLELADVVRQAANIGASLPRDRRRSSRRPTRQKNLPGLLVVDAVPASNTVYLEAIMGRDTSPSATPPSAGPPPRSNRPRWRRLCRPVQPRSATRTPPRPPSQEPATRPDPSNASSPDPAASTGLRRQDRRDRHRGRQEKRSRDAPTRRQDDEAVQKTSAKTDHAAAATAAGSSTSSARTTTTDAPSTGSLDFFRSEDDDGPIRQTPPGAGSSSPPRAAAFLIRRTHRPRQMTHRKTV